MEKDLKTIVENRRYYFNQEQKEPKPLNIYYDDNDKYLILTFWTRGCGDIWATIENKYIGFGLEDKFLLWNFAGDEYCCSYDLESLIQIVKESKILYEKVYQKFLLQERFSYLNLHTAFVTMSLPDDKDEKSILLYILNKNILREVCSFMDDKYVLSWTIFNNIQEKK
jgi:hypothetical protein